jgi:hypothetical protein
VRGKWWQREGNKNGRRKQGDKERKSFFPFNLGKMIYVRKRPYATFKSQRAKEKEEAWAREEEKTNRTTHNDSGIIMHTVLLNRWHLLIHRQIFNLRGAKDDVAIRVLHWGYELVRRPALVGFAINNPATKELGNTSAHRRDSVPMEYTGQKVSIMEYR